MSRCQVGYLLKGPFSIETLWRFLIGPPDHRQSVQCLLDTRANEGAEPWDLLRQQFAGLRDFAHLVRTRAIFSSHVCNGPATSAEVGRGVGCSQKFVSEISSPSREGPPGPLGVSWNRGLVLFQGSSRAPDQNRERCIAKEADVRRRRHY